MLPNRRVLRSGLRCDRGEKRCDRIRCLGGGGGGGMVEVNSAGVPVRPVGEWASGPVGLAWLIFD